ncbi:MAG: hypothetical protein MUO99_03075 [Dehalococcoidales bacterium]|nr:hypothetical protein [Dehalococcoidales bacterium]
MGRKPQIPEGRFTCATAQHGSSSHAGGCRSRQAKGPAELLLENCRKLVPAGKHQFRRMLAYRR